jgi:hypothetical protein
MASGVIFTILGSGGGALRSRARAVEDGDDDDQRDRICSSELGTLREFGDTAEAVGGRDGDSGFGSLFSIKFELDFHRRFPPVELNNQ